jgi:putative endopeptidase
MITVPRFVSCVALALTALAGCGSATPEASDARPSTGKPLSMSKAVATPAHPKPSVPAAQTTLAAVGLDAAALDKKADPCTDFYQFACGGWVAKTEIPGDEPLWGRSFSEIDKRNEEMLRKVLERSSTAKDVDADEKKLGTFYAACMDEGAVERAGIKPIKPLMDKARAVRDAKGIGALVAELHKRRIWPLFELSAEQDLKDATRIIANMDQSGLGLFDRDQYLDADDKAKALRATYLAHVGRMMQLAGLSEKDAKKAADDVMAIETELAKVSKTRVERRDPQGLYNKLDRAALAKAAPSFPWESYFKDLGVPETREVNVTSLKFFEGMGKLLETAKPDAWQSYLAWTVVRSTARSLPKKFVDESFTLASAMMGLKELPPRWKRCVETTDAAMGELLGKAFVKEAFGGESKAAAEKMVLTISDVFSREVNQLDWMDAKTKQRAVEKLKAMAYLIGYPDKWRVYDFAVEPKRFAENVLAARAFEQKRRLAKIGKPVDRDEWQMSPPAVNAYYDPQRNHMVFPAGILQPPFYSVSANVPVNLGGIGMVVGHELTHGFDDEGSQFAGNGNLENWWEPEVSKRFKEKTSCVADQYAGFEAQPGLKVNGKLTLGENIADMGGLKLAFYAYRQMRADAKEVLVADGFTEDQQFFLAHGQGWCTKMREEFERLLVQTNTHSPPKFRVNGPLMNMPEFAEAFSCTPGKPMHPAKTCSVW